MFVLTPSRVGVRVQDAVAGAVISIRRGWARAAKPEPEPDTELGRLRSEIINHGSSYAAFRLALRLDPPSLGKMLSVAGVYDLSGGRQRCAFDACTDAYAVYEDGVARGKL